MYTNIGIDTEGVFEFSQNILLKAQERRAWSTLGLVVFLLQFELEQ